MDTPLPRRLSLIRSSVVFSDVPTVTIPGRPHSSVQSAPPVLTGEDFSSVDSGLGDSVSSVGIFKFPLSRSLFLTDVVTRNSSGTRTVQTLSLFEEVGVGTSRVFRYR